ncbi:hypothetical protein HII36_15515 [Nonomuraea sp. NN258]|uniref:FUSC family protein n=1 Tax=Nonomuraea antri TaxID=2730852 RepID=UPI001568BAA8|nr:FUSC family protein [Nonomuraea antri]NRQ33243.1 hypothetical protein [Nonomuraea antri]
MVRRYAPGWLVEAVRPAPAAPDWPRMIRTSVSTVAPMVAGLLTGRLVAGVVPSMGALNASMSDKSGPYRVRLLRMGAAALAGATGFLLGRLFAGPGWGPVLVLMAVSVVAALVSTAGDVGSVIGLQLLVVTVLGLGMPVPVSPWPGALLFLAGASFALVLAIAAWPVRPRAPESTLVAGVYRSLAHLMQSPDEDRVQAYLNAGKDAYDAVLSARSSALGPDLKRNRLVALLQQASLIKNAVLALRQEGVRPPGEYALLMSRIAHCLAGGKARPHLPETGDDDTSSLRALRSAAKGAVELVTGARVEEGQVILEPAARRHWIAKAWDHVRYGNLTRVYTTRLTLCMGVAGTVMQVSGLQRSYWVPLTVALVLKPDFGSVFARAVQRGAGTVAGALIGSVLLATLPKGPAVLVPMALFALLMPYGMQRNWGLMATFQTPLVVLQVDLLAGGDAGLALVRLADTLVGCAIVLVLGYLPWPSSWHAPVGPRFADAVRAVADYLRGAFDVREPDRGRARKSAYDAVADLRTVFQRAIAEPPAVSRAVTTWWPAIVAARRVIDETAAAAARAGHGGHVPARDDVEAVVRALETIADRSKAGREPGELGRLPDEPPLDRVAEAVASLRDALHDPLDGK